MTEHEAACECDRCLDAFPTPPELCRAIVERLSLMATSKQKLLHLPEPLCILEPSAGEGAFVGAARRRWPQSDITAVEVRPLAAALKFAGADHVLTARLEACPATFLRGFDLILGNPPFKQAERHARHLLESMRVGAVLAFLLRTGFYESRQRLDFWRAWPEFGFAPIVPRPSFSLNRKGHQGTDSQSYGLFIWVRGEGKNAPPRRFPHIVWK